MSFFEAVDYETMERIERNSRLILERVSEEDHAVLQECFSWMVSLGAICVARDSNGIWYGYSGVPVFNGDKWSSRTVESAVVCGVPNDSSEILDRIFRDLGDSQSLVVITDSDAIVSRRVFHEGFAI